MDGTLTRDRAVGRAPTVARNLHGGRFHALGRHVAGRKRHRRRRYFRVTGTSAAHRARSALNLFAYTGGVGVAAALAGATDVWQVDFAASALDVARTNAALNGVGGVAYVHHDAIPVLRMLAGQPAGGRRRPDVTLAARTFELVVLDPPTRATGPWGAVDLVRDYPTLCKPALGCVADGGVLAATNHVASVPVDDWVRTLHRTAEKVGRRLEVELLAPEADFPTLDGRPPLKIAWCTVRGGG